MKTRIMEGHLQYIRNTLQGNNELLKECIQIQLEERKTKWSKTTAEYLATAQIKTSEIGNMTKSAIKKKLRAWDNLQWVSEVNSKTSISMYRHRKKEIMEESIYDNTPASTILFRARTNTLPLNDRRRHTKGSTECELCKAEVEDIRHVLLFCPALKDIRSNITALQQPYPEDTDKVMEDFLFDKDSLQDIEKRKNDLYQLWRHRNKKLSTKQ